MQSKTPRAALTQSCSGSGSDSGLRVATAPPYTTLVRLELNLLRHRPPTRKLGCHELSELLGRHRLRQYLFHLEPGLNVRLRQRLDHFTVDLSDNILGHPRRPRQREPGRAHQFGVACFLEGRNRWEVRKP